MSYSAVGGELKTNAVLTTGDGKQINLGVLDKRVGIKIDFFGNKLSLTAPWTPRLWWYKHITYRLRAMKINKKEGK
jgi:hypothetical protein